jgi:hypothetical protein
MIDFTPLLRRRARRRLAVLEALDPARAQEAELLRLVARAKKTRFGRDHAFDAIDGVQSFQARVPMRRYEDFRRDYWQADFPLLRDVTWPGLVPYFALSSGTTSDVQKYIPVSRAMLRSNARAMLDLLCFHVHARPHSRLLAGRNFMLGGSSDLQEPAPGVRAGDLSGIAAAEVPWWARPRYFPPRDLALIADWEHKIALLAEASARETITSIGGTPSWLLLFFERLARLHPDRPGRLAAHWPELELVVHGGVNFAPYRPSFARWLAGSHAETREIYAASEGFIAAADRGPDDGMRLILDNGLFYEFIEADEIDAPGARRAWIGDVACGVTYAILVTSCAGLFSYLIGDLVRFVSLDPPRLLVSGRTALGLSAFGEHLIGEEIEQAVAEAAAAIGGNIVDFTVGAVFATPGHHLFLVEFAAPVAAAAPSAFLARLDERLAALNEDYRAHRAGGYGMGPPQLEIVPQGGFAAWMKSRGRLGGQNKVPRIVTDPAALDRLRRFLADYPPG